MNTKRLVALITVGELAVEHHRAIECVNNARYWYLKKLRLESQGVRPDPRADEYTPERELVEATKIEYAALKEAQRVAYNIKRRLQNACRKV